LMSMDCLKAGLRWPVSWMFVLIAIPFGALIQALWITPLIEGPPTVILASALLNDSLHTGDALRFRITPVVRPNRQCNGHIDREFSRRITVDGVEMWEIHRENMTGAPIPDETRVPYVTVVPLPKHVTPGDWRYRGRTVYDCGFWLGGIQNYDTPPLYFRVEP